MSYFIFFLLLLLCLLSCLVFGILFLDAADSMCERVYFFQSFSRIFLSERDFLFILHLILCSFDAVFFLVFVIILFSRSVDVDPNRRMVKIKSSLKMLKLNQHTRKSNAQKCFFFLFYFFFVFFFLLLLLFSRSALFYCVFSLVFFRR